MPQFQPVSQGATVTRYANESASLALFTIRTTSSVRLATSLDVSATEVQTKTSQALKNHIENCSVNIYGNETIISPADREPTSDNIGEEGAHANVFKVDGQICEDCQQAFHEFLQAVYNEKSPVETRDILPTFLIFRVMEEDGKFKAPKLITPIYAGFKFIGKAMITKEFYKQSLGCSQVLDAK